MDILDVQNVYENIITVQQLRTQSGTVERVKYHTRLVGICHDPVNDTVMLVKQPLNGSMMVTDRFPVIFQMNCVTHHESLMQGIQLATGASVKSASFITTIMDLPEVAWAPTHLYYVTFDSRTVEPQEGVRLLTAKELYQEVANGQHNDLGVVYGAHYLKMMHHNIIK